MIRRSFVYFLVSSIAVLVTWNSSLRAQANPDWHRPFPAFKIAGNLYYVGTADLAVYLINGNPLIDPDGYKAYVAEREATFQKEWKRQQQNPGSPAP